MFFSMLAIEAEPGALLVVRRENMGSVVSRLARAHGALAGLGAAAFAQEALEAHRAQGCRHRVHLGGLTTLRSSAS